MITAILAIASGIRSAQITNLMAEKDLAKLNIERKKSRIIYYVSLALILQALVLLYTFIHLFSFNSENVFLNVLVIVSLVLGFAPIIFLIKIQKSSYSFILGLVVIQVILSAFIYIYFKIPITINEVISFLITLSFIQGLNWERKIKYRTDFK